MKRFRILLIIALALLTITNIVVNAPIIIDACACTADAGGMATCYGDCCVLSVGKCTCYDIGTDNCTRPPLR